MYMYIPKKQNEAPGRKLPPVPPAKVSPPPPSKQVTFRVLYEYTASSDGELTIRKVAACCNVLRCAAVCCSVLQCIAVCC